MDRLLDRNEVAVKASERAEERADEARRAASTIKWNILFTALAVAALLVGAWALWAQGIEMVSGIFSAIQDAKP